MESGNFINFKEIHTEELKHAENHLMICRILHTQDLEHTGLR